jgi:ComF family protein
MGLRVIADSILTVLLAPPCAICGCVLSRPLDGAVCDDCWASIRAIPASFCPAAISRGQAIGQYEGTLRDLIHALKYDGRRSIAPRLSRLMAHYGRDVLSGAHAAIPVPLHRRRLRQRGFNQAEDLARGLGVPVKRVLERVRATTPQVDLPAEFRRANVRDAFSVRHRVLGRPDCSLQGQIVVLVDDVATTGATLEACARALKTAGVTEVRALTAARVVM